MTKRAERPAYRNEVLFAVSELLSDIPDVRKGRMFGYPAFYVGRRMFAYLYGEGVGLKLPQAQAQAQLHDGHALPFQPYGKAKMREWIELRHGEVRDYWRDRKLFLDAVAYGRSSE